ncbi:hypothetical protein F8M41_010407 [Gigaspora margarita]|uniref:Uncharacterized protein n=1 Tax=Gigaspora margarita TaxID=4874 RepID=A0A8H4EQ59_GIGMA|nr:hypothetical protein F8M41_010407 [Gigaspora margarita]
MLGRVQLTIEEIETLYLSLRLLFGADEAEEGSLVSLGGGLLAPHEILTKNHPEPTLLSFTSQFHPVRYTELVSCAMLVQ